MPYLGIAFKIAKLAQTHGGTILHGGNVDLLTKDLGDALRRQKKIIQDPDLGVIETATEVGPVIAEVKLLTLAVSKKLGIDTKGKSSIAVLEEIVKVTEANKSASAAEIKNTLDWTRTFFSEPQIQDILKADMTGVEMPQSLTDLPGIGKFLMQSATRSTQEVSRLSDFLKTAKEVPAAKPAPKRRPKKQGPSN